MDRKEAIVIVNKMYGGCVGLSDELEERIEKGELTCTNWRVLPDGRAVEMDSELGPIYTDVDSTQVEALIAEGAADWRN